jgi:hypothetical protein
MHFTDFPKRIASIEALIEKLGREKDVLRGQLDHMSGSKPNKIAKQKARIAQCEKEIAANKKVREEIRDKWSSTMDDIEDNLEGADAEHVQAFSAIPMFTPVYGGTTDGWYGGPVASQDFKTGQPMVHCMARGIPFDGKLALDVARDASCRFRYMAEAMADVPGMHGYTGSKSRPWMEGDDDDTLLEAHKALRYELLEMSDKDADYPMCSTMYAMSSMMLTLDLGPKFADDPAVHVARRYLGLHAGTMSFSRQVQEGHPDRKDTTEIVYCALFPYSAPKDEEVNCRYERMDDVWGLGRHSVCMVATKPIKKGEHLRARLTWPTLHTWFLANARRTHRLSPVLSTLPPVTMESMHGMQHLHFSVPAGMVFGHAVLFAVPEDLQHDTDFLIGFRHKIGLIALHRKGISTVNFTICTAREWVSYVTMLHDLLLARAIRSKSDVVPRAITMTRELIAAYNDMGPENLSYEMAVLHYLFLFFSGRLAKESGKDEAVQMDSSKVYFSPIDWPGRNVNVLMAPRMFLPNGDIAVSYAADADLTPDSLLAPHVGVRNLMSYMRNHDIEPKLDKNGKAEAVCANGLVFQVSTADQSIDGADGTPILEPVVGWIAVHNFLVAENGPRPHPLAAGKDTVILRSPMHRIDFPQEVEDLNEEFIMLALRELCGGWESYCDVPGLADISDWSHALPSCHVVINWFIKSVSWATSDPRINKTWFEVLHGLVVLTCENGEECVSSAPVPLRVTLLYMLLHGGLEFDENLTRMLCSPLLHSCPLASNYNTEVRTMGKNSLDATMMCLKTTEPVLAYADVRARVQCYTVWRFFCEFYADPICLSLSEVPTTSHNSMASIIVNLDAVPKGKTVGLVTCSLVCSTSEYAQFIVESAGVPRIMRYWTASLSEAHPTINVPKSVITTVDAWVEHLKWLRFYLDVRQDLSNTVIDRMVLTRASATVNVLLYLYQNKEHKGTLDFKEAVLQYLTLYFCGTPRGCRDFGSMTAGYVYFQPAFFAVPQNDTANAMFVQKSDARGRAVFSVVAIRDIPRRQFVVASPLVDNLWEYITRTGSDGTPLVRSGGSTDSSPASGDETRKVRKGVRRSALSKAPVISDVAAVNAMHAEEERRLTAERAAMKAEQKRLAHEEAARKKAEKQAAQEEEAQRKEAQRLANLAMYAAQGKLIPSKKPKKKPRAKVVPIDMASVKPAESEESPESSPSSSDEDALRLQTVEDAKSKWEELGAQRREIEKDRDSEKEEMQRLDALSAADMVAITEYERQMAEIQDKVRILREALDDRTSVLIWHREVVRQLDMDTTAALRLEVQAEEELIQLTSECTCGDPVTQRGQCGHYATCDECIHFALQSGYEPVCMRCSRNYFSDQ